MEGSPTRPDPAEAVLSVPELRDFRTINSELVGLLDQGCRAIRLNGANGQRLLVSGLSGSWTAAIEVTGDAGPELAAGLDAPNLTLVCRGSVGDGGASRLTAGRVLIMGGASPAFGYAQRGGLAMVAGTVGARAGLRQRGGDLILIGWAGPLCGECQSGGRLFTYAELGPHAGRGHRGGRFIRMDQAGRHANDEDRATVASAFHAFSPWLGPASSLVSAP